MSNITVGQVMKSFDIGRKIDGYTGVIIHAGTTENGDAIDYSSGNSTGYVLEADNPSGTQKMADQICATLVMRGVTYQSFRADTVQIDPAVEVGDAITANGTKAVVWTSRVNYGRRMTHDLEAPFDEEIDHEFPYKTRIERIFSREMEYTRSQLAITATQISAKVSKTGGNPSSFGWTLTDSDWTLKSNGSTVLRVNSSGLSVTGSGTFSGNITATSGTIGGVTIQNGTLSGITSTNIAAGGIVGGTGGSIASSTLTTGNMVSGINTNLGYGAAYGLATTQNSSTYPNVFNCTSLVNKGSFMSIGGVVCQLITKTIGGETIQYIGHYA